ncbi:hypothetical protein ACIRPK_22415 [Kitasatospora sp. NPDC101801]|uniref:hypothetical protein n=1 Tax=Kitasatospora sp. NPDC101801 TaxID=3364103 RepID=UPI0037F69FF8
MSEFQFYQFAAIERPLTAEQMVEVRRTSTRAEITPTSFVNTYQWGDFKGSCEQLMESCYDAHLYFANWGDRKVVLRWSADDLPLAVARRYCVGPSAQVRQSGDRVILTLSSEDQDGDHDDFEDLFDRGDRGDRGDWGDEHGAEEHWLPSIAEARHDVAAGDLRLLYLAWLLCVGGGEVPDHAVGPPLPAGLEDLPHSLADLTTFLRIDADLVTAAATARSQPDPVLEPGLPGERVAALPDEDKNAPLRRLPSEDPKQVAAALRRRLRQDRPKALADGSSAGVRTAGQLRAAVSDVTAGRLAREAAERRVREEAVREAAVVAQRGRVTVLAGDREGAWARVEDLIGRRAGRDYATAVQLLADLAALAEQDGATAEFDERLHELRQRHRTRKAFLRELTAVGL